MGSLAGENDSESGLGLAEETADVPRSKKSAADGIAALSGGAEIL